MGLEAYQESSTDFSLNISFYKINKIIHNNYWNSLILEAYCLGIKGMTLLSDSFLRLGR